MDLAQAKHAFITGGASGIGLAIAEALAAQGVPITIADIDAEGLQHVTRERGGCMRIQAFDTRDRTAWARAKAEAEAERGPVDILVNNAGIGPNGRQLADINPVDFDRILAINVTGVFNGVSAFAADMRARGRGHIVNTSSMAGLSFGFPGLGGYAASKFAVVALSETLRAELAPHGVGVSVLCPGLVKTNLGRTTARLGGETRNGRSEMPDSPVTTADVAKKVLHAIADDLPYVITHPDRWADVEKRMNALRSAFR